MGTERGLQSKAGFHPPFVLTVMAQSRKPYVGVHESPPIDKTLLFTWVKVSLDPDLLLSLMFPKVRGLFPS